MIKKILIFNIVFICILGWIGFSSSAQALLLQGDSIFSHQIVEEKSMVIKFNDGVSKSELLEFCEKYNVKFTRKIDEYRIYGLVLPPDADDRLVEKIRQDKIVKFIHPDYKLENQSSEDGSDVVGNYLESNKSLFESLGLFKALEYLQEGDLEGKDKVIIAIPEYTGFSEYLINELEERGYLWTNTDEIPGNGEDDDNNGIKDDIHGTHFYKPNNIILKDANITDIDTEIEKENHGTEILSFSSSLTRGSIELLPLKYDAKISTLINSIAYASKEARQEGAKLVVNISANLAKEDFKEKWMGRLDKWGYPSDLLTEKFANALASLEFEQLKDKKDFEEFSENVLLTATGSNDPFTLETYPATYPNVLGVGQLNAKGELDQPFGGVDIYVPSQKVKVLENDRGIEEIGGTSFGANIVSAAAGFIITEEPDLSIEEVRSILLESSDVIYSSSRRRGAVDKIGGYYKRLDILDAVKTTRVYSGVRRLYEMVENQEQIGGKDELDKSLEKIFSDADQEGRDDYKESLKEIFNSLTQDEISKGEAKVKINDLLAKVYRKASQNGNKSIISALAVNLDVSNNKKGINAIVKKTTPSLGQTETSKIIQYSNFNATEAVKSATFYKGLTEFIETMENNKDKIGYEAVESLFKDFPDLLQKENTKLNSLVNGLKQDNITTEEAKVKLDKILWDTGCESIRGAQLVDITSNQDGDRLSNLLQHINDNYENILSYEEIGKIIDSSYDSEGNFDAQKTVKKVNKSHIWKKIEKNFKQLENALSEKAQSAGRKVWERVMKKAEGKSESKKKEVINWLNKRLVYSLVYGLEVGVPELDNVSDSVEIKEKLDLVNGEKNILSNLHELIGDKPLPDSIIGTLSKINTEVEIGIISAEEAITDLEDVINNCEELPSEIKEIADFQLNSQSEIDSEENNLNFTPNFENTDILPPQNLQSNFKFDPSLNLNSSPTSSKSMLLF